jgi:PAS domain S-box-containing protein
MNAEQRTPAEELRVFDARNTPEGRFRRYARARRVGFMERQLHTVVGSVVMGFVVSPLFGLMLAALTLCGEAVDLLYLRRAVSRYLTEQGLRRAQRTSAVTGFIQGLSLGLCVILAWYSGENDMTHYFSMAFLLGAVVNAGLNWDLNRDASIARISLYIAIGLWLNLSDIWLRGEVDGRVYLDSFATVLLAYMVFLLLRHAHNVFQQRHQRDRSFLAQKQSLEEAHISLRTKEIHASNLALVAQYANDSVIISGADRKIEWVNPAFSRTTGFSAAEAVGRETGELLNSAITAPEDINKIATALASKRPIRIELINKTKSDAVIWVETNITPILDDHGNIAKVIAVERDITSNKERERELAAAKIAAEEGARAKENFLATMSHEIRTPLNGIIGMADLLSQTPLEGDQIKFNETILSSGEALLRIINDILELSKLGAGEVKLLHEPFQLADCVSSAVRLLRSLAEEKGLKVSLILPENDQAYSFGDEGRIRQVVINLVGNAIKFTHEGEIKVEVSVVSGDGPDQVSIAVTDTGIGVAPGALTRIFSVFSQAEEDTTRNYGGTGLGLAISRRVAVEMDGAIEATSELGVGSCFTFSLALDPAPTPKPETVTAARQLPETNSLRDKHILVAEDNRTNRLLIRKMLERHTGQLSFAQDGAEAVAKFKESRPDIVLMDISMPKKNGLQATREIRSAETNERDRAIIIALTANAFESDREQCLAAEMDGFLTKPIKMRELLKTVAAYLP